MPVFALTAYEFGQKAAVVTLAVLLILLVRRALTARGNKRATDVLAAVVVGVLLVGAITRSGGAEPGWEDADGRNMRAGFLAGCENNGVAPSQCQCVFAQLSSSPAYDTPAKFATLEEPVRRATETGNPALIPAEYVAAIQACVPPRA